MIESSVFFRLYEKPMFSIRVIPEELKKGFWKPIEDPKKIIIELREDQYDTIEKIAIYSDLELPDYILLLVLLELNRLVCSEEEKRRILSEAGDDPDEVDSPNGSELSQIG